MKIDIIFTNKYIYILGNDYEQFNDYIRRTKSYYHCTSCKSYKNKSMVNVREHIEAKHFPGTFQYPCLSCGKSLTSMLAFRDHARQCKKGAVITPNYRCLYFKHCNQSFDSKAAHREHFSLCRTLYE